MGLAGLHPAAVDEAWLEALRLSAGSSSSSSRAASSSSGSSGGSGQIETRRANTAAVSSARNRRVLAVKAVLHDYSQTTTIHGIGLIGRTGSNSFERIFWVVAVAICGALMCYITYDQWSIYMAQQSKVRIQTNDYDTKNVRFPAVTVCPDFVLQPHLAFRILDRMVRMNYSNAHTNGSARLDYGLLDLISKLNAFSIARSSLLFKAIDLSEPFIPYLDNILAIPQFMRRTRFKCDDLLLRCAWRGVPFDCCDRFSEQNTAIGYCISFNSKTSLKQTHCSTSGCRMSSNGIETGLQIVFKKFPRDTFSLLSKLKAHMATAYGRQIRSHRPRSEEEAIFQENSFLNFFAWEAANAIMVTAHDQKSFPDVSKAFTISTTSPASYDMSVSLVVTKATPGLRTMNIKDRRCIFTGEMKLLTSKYYTQRGCLDDSKLSLLIRHCGCRPYFAPLLPGSIYDHVPECKLSHIHCFSKLSRPPDYGAMQNESEPGAQCADCLPACDTNDFTARIRRLPNRAGRKEGPSIDIAYDQFRTVVYFQRSPAFTSVDLLVTIGGLVSLCLGCSFLSGLDVVHMTARVLLSATGFKLKPIHHHHDHSSDQHKLFGVGPDKVIIKKRSVHEKSLPRKNFLREHPIP